MITLIFRVIEIKFRQFAERAMKPGGIKVRRPWQEFLQAMDTLQSFQHAERNDTASVDVHGRPDATSPVYAWIPQENREEPQFDFCFSDYAKAQSQMTNTAS